MGQEVSALSFGLNRIINQAEMWLFYAYRFRMLLMLICNLCVQCCWYIWH